jgi:hypothetical protein
MSTSILVSDSTSFTTANPPPLKQDNWHAWEPLMIAYLRSCGEYRLVAGQLARLSPPQLLVEGTTTAGVAIPFTLDQQMFNARLTNTFNESVEKYDVLQEKACGDMMKFLSPSQRVHVKGKEGDGPGMWAAFVAIRLQQAPGTRFRAYNELFSIVKSPSGSLTNVSARVSDAMGHIQELRPQGFNIKKNKDQRACRAAGTPATAPAVVEAALAASLRSSTPSRSLADAHWIADTGAMSQRKRAEKAFSNC